MMVLPGQPSYVNDSIEWAVNRLEAFYTAREVRMRRVALVRAGNIELLNPDLFSVDWPKSVVANYIDVAARDVSETIAQYPTLSASAGDLSSEKGRKFAAKKARIGMGYWQQSNMRKHLVGGADQYVSYGFVPIVVEIDPEHRGPVLRFDDAVGAYPEFDRWGKVVRYCRVWQDESQVIAAAYPEFAHVIMPKHTNGADTVTLVRYMDDKEVILYVRNREGLILERFDHRLSRCPVAVARRPGLDDTMRGQYDDVIWIQMARAKMAMLALEAAEKEVTAPIAVPDDMVDLPIGPDSVWRSNNPQNIRRVQLGVGQATFAESALLQQEMATGSRYNQARTGNLNASIVTGRGVEALMGGFDSQIGTAQTMIGHALMEATSIAFEMDEMWFPDVAKTVRGSIKGTPYTVKYTPSKDIGGDYTCQVTYGFMAGLSINQAAVLLLQLRGDKAISREMMMKQMPFEVDVDAELRNIDVEETRDATKQAIFAAGSAIPQMVMQGADPTQIIQAMATFADLRMKGKSVEEAALEAFKPPEPSPQEQAAAAAQQQPPGGPQQGLPANGGLPPGVAQGQAELGPGGQPSMQMLLAGMRNGRANLSAQVSRRLPAG